MSANGEIEIAVTAEGADDAAQELADQDGGGVNVSGGGDGGGGGGGGGMPMGGGGGMIASIVSKLGVVAGLLGIVVAAVAALPGMMQMLKGMFKILQAFLAPLSMMLMRLLQPVMALLLRLLPWVYDFFSDPIGTLKKAFDAIWATLQEVPGIIWNLLQTGFDWLLVALGALPGLIADAIAGAGEAAADKTVDTATTMPGSPIGGARGLVVQVGWNNLKNFLGGGGGNDGGGQDQQTTVAVQPKDGAQEMVEFVKSDPNVDAMDGG